MKFRFGEKQDKKVKIVGEKANDTPALPATAADAEAAPPDVASTNELSDGASCREGTSKTVSSGNAPPVTTATERQEGRTILSALGAIISMVVVVPGQVFMVAGAAVSAGTLCSSLFGLSFDRVMYHCGPQDTYLGIFVLGAVPTFWYAWHVRNRLASFALIAVVAITGLFIFSSFGSGLVGAVIGLLSVLLLGVFHLAGNYFSTFKRNWPKSFSVTRWLSICYVPAALLLSYEFSVLDLSQSVSHVSTESVLTAAGIIAAFSFLPSFLTAVDCKSRQFASGFGLSAIGQSPVLITMLTYCVANAVMLIWVSLSGTASIADYYSWQAQLRMDPDFDKQTTYAEVLSKFLSSLAVWCVLFFSVWSGSALGVSWNRWRHHS